MYGAVQIVVFVLFVLEICIYHLPLVTMNEK